MSVSLDDVRHIASLARLGLSEDRAAAATAELNTILAHMEVLSRVKTEDVDDAPLTAGMPVSLRPDRGPPVPLGLAPGTFAPRARDGFFLVPRLSTHEDPEDPS